MRERRLFGRLMVPLLAAGLALLGPSPPSPASDAPDLSAYAMPDGTLPDICGWDLDGAPHPQATGAHCPACVVGKALLRVPAFGVAPRARVLLAPPVALAPRPLPARPSARAPPARGPPPGSVA